jgi:hypothetical protein
LPISVLSLRRKHTYFSLSQYIKYIFESPFQTLSSMLPPIDVLLFIDWDIVLASYTNIFI